MTSYPPYYQYIDQQPEVLITSNAYGYPQYDPRSKTPTSLINHTGHSPGPLSTPPLSRDASRAPEPPPDQPPEHMVYDDPSISSSNSPTSVRTPDGDPFEVEMLDSSRDFYANQNGPMLTAHTSQGAMAPIAAPEYWSAQTIQDVLTSAMATQSQQFQAQYAIPARQVPNVMAPQSFHNFVNHNYTNQPPAQDPWNGQGPPRNPNIPRPGIAVFDPMTDQVDYSGSAFMNVDYWASNNTDPNYLISPNAAEAPPQDLFSMPTQAFMPQSDNNRAEAQNQMQDASPIEMRVITASPSPDSQNFVNYTADSDLFTSSYVTGSGFSPSLATPVDQVPNSPLASASSPGGSDAMFSSYQRSDADMDIDPYSFERFDALFPPPPSSVEMEASPSRTMQSDGILEVSPEPEQPKTQPTRRSGATKGSGRPGGRALGTHLEPKVAKAAHDMRKIVACWHCVLQRDKCGPGDICERCLKRSQRPNADCGLGCSRIKLVELAHYFLPMLVMQIHEDANLTHFVSQYIHQWGNQEITIFMTCSQKSMPRIPVKVYEFAPRGKELLQQIQYKTNQRTLERIQFIMQSPPLGMVHINHNEEKKYDKYISDIVDNHLDAFADICWADDDNDFAPRLFKLMTRVKPKGDDEAKLLREVFRLVVCTFIMSHTLSIAEETKAQTLSKMHSYTGPHSYVQNFTSPRMASRQLKYFFARLQRTTLAAVLNKLQQIFKSSKGCDKWLAAFVAVTGMAMAHEDQQKIVHQVMQTRAQTEGFDVRDAQAQADIACREIDGRMNFISQIFRWKYNRKCNPLKDSEHEWEKEVGFGDESSVTFVRSVAQLVKDNMNYLNQRQGVSISASNQGRYTARLVGSFLLSFWLPQ